MTSKPPVGGISVVTLIRTDTTLDHSQKAEKVWLTRVSLVVGAANPLHWLPRCAIACQVTQHVQNGRKASACAADGVSPRGSASQKCLCLAQVLIIQRLAHRPTRPSLATQKTSSNIAKRFQKHKRPAGLHQPKVYLEPKWLRCYVEHTCAFQ